MLMFLKQMQISLLSLKTVKIGYLMKYMTFMPENCLYNKGIISYLGTISAKLVSMCLNTDIHIELYVQENFQSRFKEF